MQSEPEGEARPELAEHEVQPTDSLCSIAALHGVGLAALASANGLSTDASPDPGTTLRIPEGDRASYRVREGDTLSGISRWSGLSVAQLAAVNGLPDPDRVRAGSILTLPAGARTVCPPAPPQAGPRQLARQAPPKPAPSAGAAPPPDDLPSAELAAAEALYERGDYERALEEADEVVARVEDVEGESAARIRARGELVAALALVGLQDHEGATARFEAALRARPDLLLDPSQHAPKVRWLFEQARNRALREPLAP